MYCVNQMCAIIVTIAPATSSEGKWEKENREAHQTEEEERGTEQAFYNKLQNGSSE